MAKLNDKHLRCLELLKQNKTSIKDVAKTVGISYDHLIALMNADPKTGELGQLFKSEYNKLVRGLEEDIARKSTQARNLAISKVLSWLKTINKVDSKLRHKQLIDSINALTKAVPTLNIEANVFQTGLSKEDLVNEFRKLTSMVEAATHGSAIPEVEQNGSREIPFSLEGRSAEDQAEQDQALPPISETDEISPVEGFDQGDFRGKPKREDDSGSS